KKIVEHQGIFLPEGNLFEAIALIVSGTIGAGVLGIPFAVAKVGIFFGILYIVALGFLMMGLNLLLGEIAARTKQHFQLAGLAGMYLGFFGKWIMTAIAYASMLGVLVVYIIGEGETLAALLGGNSFTWSLVFLFVMSVPVVLGMRTIKVIEFVLTLAILAVVLLIVMWSAPYVEWSHISYHNPAYIFFPYGVILFAFSGSAAVPEAHSILAHKDLEFKKAIMYAAIITTVVYSLFAFITVGVTGAQTTEIATVGLGQKLGPWMFVLGNVFAVLAMATSFLMTALALRDSMAWDFKVKQSLSNVLVLGLPLLVFVLGIRQFIAAIDFVGGVLISAQLLLIILIYLRAKQMGHLEKSKYNLHNTLWLVLLLVLAFSVGALYSVFKLF
ncbi:MAG: hypothetical protein COU33_05105, partial [Candidatus Magasanikbacteria bacterium CG10_big_fil_rev_8_21_14_0_10_43_6]